MPYRLLSEDGSLEAGLRRVATEQVDKALAALETSGEARAKGVHEVRKACKKLRALIRMVRPSFAAYPRENAAFRDIAALLGPLRDAGVMHHTFDALVAEHAPALNAAALAPIRAALTAHRPARHDEAEVDALFQEARGELRAARARIALWTLEEDGWKALGPGIARTYAQARKTAAKAAKKGGAERHHEWRKRIKDHWYHTRLLRPVWPERMKERASEARALAELLGGHHDCHVLEEALAANPAAFGDAATVETIVALARDRRAQLEESAHRLGARLLAADTDNLLDRWEVWWNNWCAEGALQQPPGGQ